MQHQLRFLYTTMGPPHSYHRLSLPSICCTDHEATRNFPHMPRYIEPLIIIGHPLPHLEFVSWFIKSQLIDSHGACMQLMVGTLAPLWSHIDATMFGSGRPIWNESVTLLHGTLPKSISLQSLTATLSLQPFRTFYKSCGTCYLISPCHPLTLHMYRHSLTSLLCLHKSSPPIAHL